MSDKYIDLEEQLLERLAPYSAPTALAANRILKALDRLIEENPDQVPGRTITESEWSEYVNSTNGKYLAGADLLEKAGITVVPDPEPSNAEKLEDALRRALPAGTSYSWESMARKLDEQGVKAPGADDDH